MYKAKEKYRGVFEIQKSGDKTSSGEIGLDIRTHASPKVGQDQVSGGVSVLCWHAAPVAYVLWKPCTNNSSIIIATHMSYNYFPCVEGRSINNIRKYLPIFRATLITVCCLCSYICTVLEAGNRVCYHMDANTL